MQTRRRIGPYEILEKLGAGGMGEVYRARDRRLHRDVAIKRLPEELAKDPARRRDLLNEARSAARISHPNVATVHDVVELDDELFLVMELVEGVTLKRRLGRAITLDAALDIIIQCAQGVAAAHRQGVVHRDIKPDNVMIGPDGIVKVLDFGVATLPAALSADTQTETSVDASLGSSPAGTVPFMAPEVLLGEESDERADVFSLGVTLYNMVTGKHPFAARTGPATVDRILNHAPRQPAERNPVVSARLDAVITRMLAKEPADRYPDLDSVLADLQAVREEMTSSGPPTVADFDAEPARAATQRAGLPGRLGWAAAATVVVALAGVWLWGVGTDGVVEGPSVSSARFEASDWLIAVLPAPVADDDAELRALGHGLAATLTSKLTQMSRAHDLQVVPTSAVIERGVDSFLSARRELGITLAIDFHLRRVGDRLRVNVNLIDTAAERQLDSATVDGALADPIDLEEQVALRALRMLRIELAPMDQRVLRAGTDEPRAHDYYLRALGYLQEYADPGSVEAAVDLLEQSLRIDPGYARAQAALGEAFWNRYRLTDDAVWVDRARQQCETAITLDPDESSGHRCLGTVLNGTGQPLEATAALERAKSLDPTNDATYIALGSVYQNQGEAALAEQTYEEAVALRPHYWGGYSWLGTFLLRAGRIEEATENLEQVVMLAPDNYAGYSNLGVAYYFSQDWTRARQAFERALELNPGFSRALSNLGTLYFYEGSYARSARMFERALETDADNYLAWGNLGDAYYWTEGERGRAAEAYARSIALAEERLAVNPRDAVVLARTARHRIMVGEESAALDNLERALSQRPDDNEVLQAAAQVYEMMGDREAALDYLERAVEAGYPVAEIDVDPVFASLRTDPRYARIAGR